VCGKGLPGRELTVCFAGEQEEEEVLRRKVARLKSRINWGRGEKPENGGKD